MKPKRGQVEKQRPGTETKIFFLLGVFFNGKVSFMRWWKGDSQKIACRFIRSILIMF
jgi:hypothetical protein